MLSLPLECQTYILIYLTDKELTRLSECCHQTQCYYNDYQIRNLMMIIQNKIFINYKLLYHNYFYCKQYYKNKVWINNDGQQITLTQYYHPWERYCCPMIQYNNVRYSQFNISYDKEKFIVFDNVKYY